MVPLIEELLLNPSVFHGLLTSAPRRLRFFSQKLLVSLLLLYQVYNDIEKKATQASRFQKPNALQEVLATSRCRNGLQGVPATNRCRNGPQEVPARSPYPNGLRGTVLPEAIGLCQVDLVRLHRHLGLIQGGRALKKNVLLLAATVGYHLLIDYVWVPRRKEMLVQSFRNGFTVIALPNSYGERQRVACLVYPKISQQNPSKDLSNRILLASKHDL